MYVDFFLCTDVYLFIYLYFNIFTMFFNLLCISTFEQCHLEPWRYINAFIIIIVPSCV